ncbi:MAG: cation-translocating P-type ATPase [Spirochaetia bacterium]|nr:cation-translocating P-type ATPase [Spirochaetia bacterium]
MNWHLMNVKESLELLGSRVTGISVEEARDRLETYGRNELQEKPTRPVWALFLDQFKDVMILILLTAALISGLIGDLKDTMVILVIVVLNAAIGLAQEYKAERALEALKKMAAPNANVLRANQMCQIASAELVPGDVVLLEAGSVVPADLRLIETHALHVEEASLTGESQPVEKHTREIEGEQITLGDRLNMVYKGTTVTYGRGTGLAIATGMHTELGRVAQMLQSDGESTPLQKRLAAFGKKLSLAVVAICFLLYGVGLIRGEDPVGMLLVAISIAVAAIPEALPAVVSIVLALGARRLVKENALIRKLPAVETLGSVTFICSDKTGTLTQNRMKVMGTWVPVTQNTAGIELSLGMLLNQDVRQSESGLAGDPTEIALIEAALEARPAGAAELIQFKRASEIPFDSERKRMTTVHQFNDQFLVITKGAVESVIAVCKGVDSEAALQEAERFAREGMRVIAFSAKLAPELPDVSNMETNLAFLGLAGMMDPPREEASRAIADCYGAGIVPVMITGDHPLTAAAIAHNIGLLQNNQDRIVTGPELEKMSDADFESQVERIKVYARVAPEQKLRIVRMLQSRGHFVAMTGDGVNDAPALKRADIGVAMGITGTDVSREAAHMVLLDDNFATIAKAVREGRRIFDNIKKFIKYTMTSNSGEIWTIFLAPLMGLPIPLLPIQILWVNLVTDGLPGLALAAEEAEPNVMKRPPRKPTESIFAEGMVLHILWVGFLMGAVCLALQAWAIHVRSPHWQTMVFSVLCLSQMGHAMAIRSAYRSLFSQGIFSNPALAGAIALTFILQAAIVYVPALRPIFETTPLPPRELIVCLVLSSVVFWGVELEKLWKRRGRNSRVGLAS